MLNLTLQRLPSNAVCTLGTIIGGYSCRTLEPVVREVKGPPVEQWKIWGKTAIPEGRYQILMQFSPKFGKLMPHLQAVPGFQDIMIHPLNFPNETEGCIGVGQSAGDSTLFSSKAAFAPLDDMIVAAIGNDEEVWIEIMNPHGETDGQ